MIQDEWYLVDFCPPDLHFPKKVARVEYSWDKKTWHRRISPSASNHMIFPYTCANLRDMEIVSTFPLPFDRGIVYPVHGKGLFRRCTFYDGSYSEISEVPCAELEGRL